MPDEAGFASVRDRRLEDESEDTPGSLRQREFDAIRSLKEMMERLPQTEAPTWFPSPDKDPRRVTWSA